MERNPERVLLDEGKLIEQIQCNNIETRNGSFGSANQRLIHDSSSNMNTNTGPSDYNLSIGARPLLNYSIQTGEEFVLAFMRETAAPRQYLPPSSHVNCIASSNLNPPDNLRNNCSGSQSKMENSHVIRMGDINLFEFERKNPSASKDDNFSRSVQTIPQSSSRSDKCKELQRYAPSGDSCRSSSVRFLCSFGGKILPRPSDMKLRYAGGVTRLIRIKKDISWAVLKQKAIEIYNQAQIIKYQLPGEGLDALVSVCCDEDLQIMMEECKLLENGGSQTPRMFLFSNTSIEDASINVGDTEGDSEFQYLIAVNGMDLSIKRNLTGLTNHFENNLDKMLVLCNERGTETQRGEINKWNTTSLLLNVSSSIIQSSHLLSPTSPCGYDSSSQLNQEYHHKEASHHGFTQLVEIFPKIGDSGKAQYLENEIGKCIPNMNDSDGRIQFIENQKIPSSSPSNCLSDNMPKKQGSNVNPSADERSPLLLSCPCDCSLSDNTPSNVNPSADERSPPLPSCPCDCSPSNNIPRKQGSNANPLADDGSPLSPSVKRNLKHQENFYSSVLRGTVNKGMTVVPDHFLIFSGASTSKQNSPVIFLDTNCESEKISKYKEIPENIDKKNADVSLVTDVGIYAADYADNQVVTMVDKNSDDHSIELSRTFQTRHDADYHSSFQSAGEINSDKEQFQRVKMIAGDDNATNKKQLPPLVFNDNPASGILPVVSSVAIGSIGHSDTPLDISDRLPLDFLSDMFSKANVSGDILDLSPLQVNETGVTSNIENHDPKHSLHSRDLFQEEFVTNIISLIDLDINPLTNVQGDPSADYRFPPFKAEGLLLGQSNSVIVEENIPQMSSFVLGIESNAMNLHSDYTAGPLKETDGAQMDEMNVCSLDLKSRDGKNTPGSLLNRSLGDVKISVLQIINNEDLEELRELGSGTFGQVFHGKWRGTDVAIKRIKRKSSGEFSEKERLILEFWREAEILSKLHHPNIVAFYGAVQDGPGGTLAIVTEYMANGSLKNVLLCNARHLDRHMRLIIAMDAAFGMEYLHSKNIVHFDLKCDNLLVDLRDPARPICKVNDFGMSRTKRHTMLTHDLRGTLPWMAPELLNGSSCKVSEKVDVFSFGIVLWEILTGEEPYADLHYGAIIGGIVHNTLRPPVPSICDPEWRTLMEQCWDPNPFARPSFTEIARRLRAMSEAYESRPAGH